mgnify:CR=1 FL=1
MEVSSSSNSFLFSSPATVSGGNKAIISEAKNSLITGGQPRPGKNDLVFQSPEHLDGVYNGDTDCNNGNLDSWCYDTDGDGNACDNCSTTLFNTVCSNTGDLRTCEPYIDSLYYYHGTGYGLDGNLTNMPIEWYNNNPDLEEYISPTIRGPYGVNQHSDFEPLNALGIPNSTSLIIDDGL